MPSEWWRDAVFYEIYVRSFADSNGDGFGDLPGITGRLPHLRDLGVDAIWLTPFYPSPGADHGYDVADYVGVDPLFGTLDDFDELLSSAHATGLRVIVDIVPNHTSSAHAWFAGDRSRYVTVPATGSLPNNWPSNFGGPAWTLDEERDEYYLHLFAPEQPDLDWHNPQVHADFDEILRFWLDRGVDGFRIDAAHGMCKQLDGSPSSSDDDPRFDQDDVHDVHRMIRATLDHYPERVAIGAVGVRNAARFARYVRQDELHLAVDTQLAASRFDAEEVRAAIEDCLKAVGSVGAAASWLLSDHDVSRPASRYGAGPVGTARARAMALVQLALPGAAYLYNGDELGMPDVDLPDEALQDPIWERSGHTERGRDACRIPVPWSGTAPSYGFSPRAETWLPMPEGWESLTAAAQEDDPGSVLSLYRAALTLRRTSPAFAGESLDWVPAPDGCLAFRRPGGLVCLLNLSGAAVPLPEGRVLLASADTAGGVLPDDAAVWLHA
ncbi:MAG: alpha-amylase family glycosyl hydrolase [Gaiellaceae bacterium]